jgi:curli production assembly/transport component CsgG
MMRAGLISVAFLSLTGCDVRRFDPPPLEISPPTIIEKSSIAELAELKEPKGEAIFVGVYNFVDQTGQKAVTDRQVSEMSSAVPQGLSAMLVQELERAGNGKYYRVVERENVDALLGERRIAAAMLGDNAQEQLGNLFVPGVLLTGGAVSYDRNVSQRIMGVGLASVNGTDEIVSDQVGIVIRAVSVKTGEVLATVMTTKTVVSRQRGAHVLAIIGENVAAAELGGASNEPVSVATRLAIAAGVIELTKQGEADGWWEP